MRQMRRAAWLAAALLSCACSSGSTPPGGSATPAAPSTAGDTPGATASSPAAGGDVRFPVAGQPPQTGTPWYLAIGDSITFGFTLDPARDGVNSSWALQLQDLLAGSGRRWKLYDVACPGETSLTYRTLCPQRRFVPFLADTSQHDAAQRAIDDHRADLKLILVDLGSNDLLRFLRSGTDPATAFTGLRTRLRVIVTELQQAAPGVPVVIANYYNPLANSTPSTISTLSVVNNGIAALAHDLGARLADFHDAINAPSVPDPTLCDYVDCAHLDIHPTVAGQARLAAAAYAALS